MIIGLTGGIGSGKSTVAALLKEMGLYIIDVDRRYHLLLTPGSFIIQQIRENFGSRYFNSDGTLNRKLLGAVVFKNPEKLRLLENITHPVINEEILTLVSEARHSKRDTILDHPLLFEMKMESLVDEVWVVTIPKSLQISRLCKRDSIGLEEATYRIKAQIPLEFKVSKADVVINNTGSIEELRVSLEKIWKERKQCSQK